MATMNKNTQRIRRHGRVRGKVSGTSERPRLAVFRSNKHLYAQVIDDTKGHTVAASSDRAITGSDTKPMKEVAVLIGADIAKKAQAAGITTVVFDKGGFTYSGNISALAQGAREGGLTF